MKSVTLLEFQKMSGLSDKALVWLLCNRKLPCSVDKNNDLVIDPSAVEVKNLIQSLVSLSADTMAVRQALIEERIGALMAEKIDEMVELVAAKLEAE